MTEKLLLFCCLLFGTISMTEAQEDSLSNSPLEIPRNGLLELEAAKTDEVIISTASKRVEALQDAPAIVQVITAQDIAIYGVNSLKELLERATGLFMNGSYLYPQNLTAVRGDMLTHIDNHVLILLDGRPMRESIYGGINSPIYLALPLSAVQQVEIIRGPGSVLYGTNAYSGVINIITNVYESANTKLDGTFDISAGTFGTVNLDGGFAFKKKGVKVRVFGKIFQEDGWEMSAVGEDQNSFSTLYEEENKSIGVLLDHNKFSVKYLYLQSEQRHLSSSAVFRDQFLYTDRTFLDVGNQHQFTENWKAEVHATFNGMRMNFDLPPGPHEERGAGLLLEYTHFIEINNNLNIIAGVTGQYLEGIGEIFIPNGNTFDMIPESSITWFTGYLQADYNLTDWMKLTVGGQLNKPQDTPLNIVPRIGLTVRSNDKPYGGKLLFGQAFRSAFIGENQINVPNVLVGPASRNEPLLKPETITTFDAQVYYIKNQNQLALTVFRSNQTDLISRISDLDTASSASIYVNQGGLNSYGFEIEGNFRVGNFGFDGNYAYQTNENTENNAVNYTTVPNHMLKLGLNLRATSYLTFAASNNWYSIPEDVRVRNPNSEAVNPSPRAFSILTGKINLNLNNLLGYRQTTRLSFFVYCYNLLDEKVYLPEFNRSRINSLPATQGRGVYAGLTVKF